MGREGGLGLSFDSIQCNDVVFKEWQLVLTQQTGAALRDQGCTWLRCTSGLLCALSGGGLTCFFSV